MLKSLINELVSLSNIQLLVVLDWRIQTLILSKNIETIIIGKDQSVFEQLPDLISQVDLVWPIAPEMDSVLLKVSRLVESQSKRLLNSGSDTVAICSDKLLTNQLLQKQNIEAVNTLPLGVKLPEYSFPWVIKPKQGVGCLQNYLVRNQHEYTQVLSQIDSLDDFIIQPFVPGESLSLSCLFQQGKAWLLCCNRQIMSIEQGQFELRACEVNVLTEYRQQYVNLINAVAQVFPGLFAYVGIDIIQPKKGLPIILEINPRLTTSYAGINQAIGFNVAKAVIEMKDAIPNVHCSVNNQITISVS